MLEMTIEAVRVSLMNYNRVVILKEKESNRFLPIWIGAPEADAIAIKQNGAPVARPMTHDLLANIIEELGSKIVRIVVNDISKNTFFARVYIDFNGTELEIDSRPSDALALAVRADVPIYCEESVLDEAAVQMDDDGGLLNAPSGEERPPAVREEELEGMSAFRDFIDSLDLDDFGDK